MTLPLSTSEYEVAELDQTSDGVSRIKVNFAYNVPAESLVYRLSNDLFGKGRSRVQTETTERLFFEWSPDGCEIRRAPSKSWKKSYVIVRA